MGTIDTEGPFYEMLVDAVEVLERFGPIDDKIDDLLDKPMAKHPPDVAHAPGVLEGAGVTLGLTARELLDSVGLL